jgi:hypothetical protein
MGSLITRFGDHNAIPGIDITWWRDLTAKPEAWSCCKIVAAKKKGGGSHVEVDRFVQVVTERAALASEGRRS